VLLYVYKMLRRIFGPQTDGVTGGWKKSHNMQFHNLYSSPKSTSQGQDEMGEARSSHVGDMGSVCEILFGKSEGKI